MSAPGRPLQDAAGAACRNAAHELLDIEERVSAATDGLTREDQLRALYHMKLARLLLHRAADEYYQDGAALDFEGRHADDD